MTLLAVGDILEARTIMSLDEQLGINVRHWRVKSIDMGAPVLSRVAVELSGQSSAEYKVALTSKAQYHGVGVRRLTPTPTLEAVSDAAAGPGVGGPTPQAKQVTGIITLRSDTPGRRARGRMYIPFPATDANEANGNPTAAYLANLDDLGNDHVGDVIIDDLAGNVATITSIVWSKKFSQFYPITGKTVRDKWATQRRRGDYGATNEAPF